MAEARGVRVVIGGSTVANSRGRYPAEQGLVPEDRGARAPGRTQRPQLDFFRAGRARRVSLTIARRAATADHLRRALARNVANHPARRGSPLLMVIERITARATLQDPGEEVTRVRQEIRRGDDSWQRWLDELERGDALVATLRMTASVRLQDGTTRSVEAENHHIWLEVATHVPLLEAQIHEISSKDCLALAHQLQELGARTTADKLCDMYVHIELADDLLDAIRRRDGAVQASPDVRLGEGTETGLDAIR